MNRRAIAKTSSIASVAPWDHQRDFLYKRDQKLAQCDINFIQKIDPLEDIISTVKKTHLKWYDHIT